LSQRDPVTNVTILSGDLNGNDLSNFVNYDDNAYHVVTTSGVDATAILDGFTIRGGNADGTGWEHQGGGIINVAGSPAILNCTFVGNVADVGTDGSGGGMGSWLGDPLLVNCRFLGNKAFNGGGFYCDTPGLVGPRLINCVFSGNLAMHYGGGSAVNLANCLTNCVFSQNLANSLGGGIYQYAGVTTVSNCIFWNNSSSGGGSGESGQVYLNSGTANVSYSCIQGLSTFSGNGNIPWDPQFEDPDGADNVAGTADDDLRVWSYSPCIDAGSNATIPPDEADADGDGNTSEPTPIDLAGNPRIVDGDGSGTATVDMGAYEYNGTPFTGVLYVRKTAPAGGDGLSWATAFNELRDALPLGGRSLQVWVATGEYKPATPLYQGGSRAATFQLISGVALYGGFEGDESELSQRDPVTNVTILSGDLNGNDLSNFVNYDDNAYHVVTTSGVDATAILDGFTIRGGNADGTGWEHQGGGIINVAGSPAILNCTFVGNVADVGTDGSGGGMGSWLGDPLLVNCRFLGNKAFNGGGFYCDTPGLVGPRLINCVFSGNLAMHYGGGSAVNLANCLTNCVFSQNLANSLGGGIYQYAGVTTVSNCIFWNNSSSGGGSGESGQVYLNSGTANVSYSCIQGLSTFSGNNNIGTEPFFADADGADNTSGTPDDDFHLRGISTCIDVGSNAAVPPDMTDLDGDGNTSEPTPIDLEGSPRILDGNGDGTLTVDMGACEYDGPVFSGVLYVNAVAGAGGDGLSWATAFQTLQDGLSLAAEAAGPATPVQVWVAAGAYKPTARDDPNDPQSAVFRLVDGVAVYGGFAGTEASLAERDPEANVTILDGERGVPGDPLPGDNVRVLVRAQSCGAGTKIDGFTITRAAERAVSFSSGNPVIARCILLRNYSAVYCEYGSQTIVSCRFWGNGNSDSGVGVYLRNGGNVTIANCEFVGNRTSGWGAALEAYLGSAEATVTNCTFFGNSAPGEGSLAVIVSAQLVMNNCVVGDVEGLWIDSQGAPHSWGEYSVFFGAVNGPGLMNWGPGILGAGPLFVRNPSAGPDAQWGTTDDDYGDLRLLPYAACIDAGTNLALPADAADLDGDGDLSEPLPHDLRGVLRVLDGDGDAVAGVDMGAHEYSDPPFSGVLYVKHDTAAGNDGLMWDTAFDELREALPVAAAIAGAGTPVQVWVAAGTYKPSPALNQGGSRADSFQLARNVALYGGFDGTETELTQRDPNSNETTLSGDLNSDDNGSLNKGDNSYHVIRADYVDNTAVLDGFTITAGNANVPGMSYGAVGAGLVAESGSPTIRSCRFVGNNAMAGAAVRASGGAALVVDDCDFVSNVVTRLDTFNPRGGALYLDYVNATFRRCTFEDNQVVSDMTEDGGGAVCMGRDAIVAMIACQFRRNVAQASQGGAILVRPATGSATLALVNCGFFGNSAGYSGGAVTLNLNAILSAVNCLWVGNVAAHGGGLVAGNTAGTLVNCTFVANVEYGLNGEGGAGLYMWDSSLSPTNCVLWANTTSEAVGEAAQVWCHGCTPTLNYCSVQGWTGTWGGIGNNGLDPLFVGLPNPGSDGVWGTADDDYGNLNLSAGSPAIDSGDSLAVPQDTYDIDGDGNTTENLPIDLAGQPRFVDDPLAPNTGPGFPAAYVDRGAYEFIADCPSCPGPRRWLRPLSGSFGDPANWTPSVPIAGHEALFDHRGNTFSVLFDGNTPTYPLNARLSLTNGNVTLELTNKTYQLNATAQPSIVVGNGPDAVGRLYIRNGTLHGVSAIVGAGDTTAIGEINLDASDGVSQMSLSRDLCVGCDGDGTLTIANGALVISRDASIGDQVGAFGHATVSGLGSAWSIPFFLIIDNGVLDVRDGAQVVTGFGTYVFSGGSIIGDGTILGDVVNFGDIEPGTSPGTLTIGGKYEQVGEIPELGPSSGALRLEVAGTSPGEYDRLVVNGDVTLGGGLFVELSGGYSPDPNLPLSLPILTAAGGVDPLAHFDVAFFPGITGNRFLNVTYPAPGRAGDIEIVSLPLPGQIDLGATQQATVPGVPNAIDVGDFDSDGLDDLAVSVPGQPGQPGQVVMLLTRYPGGEYAPEAASYTVGTEPAALIVGEFNTLPGLDVAVANAGSDNVMVLTNNGDGTFAPVTPETTFAVGSQPRSLSAADFDRDGRLDLAVAHWGDDSVRILLGNTRGLFVLWTSILVTDGHPTSVSCDPFDPDNDDDYDIVVTCENGTLALFVNTVGVTGSLGFNAPQTFMIGTQPQQVVVGNLRNLDGTTDILALNTLDGTVSVLLDTSTGPDDVTFAPAVNLPVRADPAGSEPRSMTLIDLDEDGDLDVVVIARNESDVVRARVLRNDWSGQQLAFAPAADLDAGSDPVAVARGDVNGDERDDLIAVNGPGGGGRSGNVVIRLHAPPPWGNLDGDGDVDLDDVALFYACLTGPDVPSTPDCAGASADADSDVDVADFAQLQAVFGQSP